MPAKVKRLAAKQLKKEISFGLLSIKTDWPVNCVPIFPFFHGNTYCMMFPM